MPVTVGALRRTPTVPRISARELTATMVRWYRWFAHPRMEAMKGNDTHGAGRRSRPRPMEEARSAAGRRIQLKKAEVEGPRDGLGAIPRSELFENRVDVPLHRPLRDADRSADVGVGQSSAEQV